MKYRRYIKKVCINLSIFSNVIMGGEYNQTFSARNYQRKKEGNKNIVPVIDFILGKDHCMMSWVNWVCRSNPVIHELKKEILTKERTGEKSTYRK